MYYTVKLYEKKGVFYGGQDKQGKQRRNKAG